MNALTGVTGARSYSYHNECSVTIQASADRLFAHLDDHMALSSHMSESSWKMGGGKMTIEVDAGGGKCVGSKIRLAGRVFGIALWVEEIVTVRVPPSRKVWETIGEPRLLVIAPYRMGFDITPKGNASVLRVYIDYELPESIVSRWLGYLFGRYYAAWCTRQMAEDAAKYFTSGAKH